MRSAVLEVGHWSLEGHEALGSHTPVHTSVKGNLGLAWEISILSLRKIHTLNYLAIRKLSHQGTISIKIVKSSFLFS